MNNKKRSLEIRNEVIELVKEKFGIKFYFNYNDLYKVKDNYIVRRLNGKISNSLEINSDQLNRYCYYNISNDENILKEFNDLVLKIDNYLKNLNYNGFEIRLNKLKSEVVFNDEIVLNIKFENI